MKKLDTSSPEAYAKTVEPYREFFADEVIGRFDSKPLPPNVRSRRGLRRAEVHRLRGRAGRLPRRDRLRHPALAQGHQGRARSGRSSSASTAWRAGRSDVADPKVDNPAYNEFAVPPGRARLHHVRTAEPVHLRGPLPHAPAQGQPAEARRSSRSSCRSTSRSPTGSRRCRYVDPAADRLLRPVATAASRRCGFRRW